MKFTAIRIEQFQKIRTVDVAPKHVVTLFCGDNDVGKTSIQDAVRMAFTGESARVAKKKHHNLLVRNGAKSGSSVVEFAHAGQAGRAAIALPASKSECVPALPPALPFVLDAAKFGAMTDIERRKFLFDMMGVKVGMDAVRERMAKRGCRPDLVEQVMQVLRTGFEPAERWATEKQAENRARWKGITGEDYGDKKAEKWSAEKAVDADRTAQLAGMRTTIANVEEERVGLQASIQSGRQYLERKAEYDRRSADLKARADSVAKLRREAELAVRTEAELAPTVEAAQKELRDARSESQPCPSCGTLLATTNGKFREVKSVSKKDITALEQKVSKLEAALRTTQQTKTKVEADYQAAKSASEALGALEAAIGKPVSTEDLDAKQAQIVELDKELADLRSQRDALAAEERESHQAAQATADAREAHNLVKSWGTIRDAVAPDGIPGELLAEAITPINQRLIAMAKLSGWGVPQLEPDMEITVNGIHYAITGESARWRADAMLAEAISHFTGLNLLILDRIDVLSPGHRGELLDWVETLAEVHGYETILLFGTLKAKPSIDGFNVYWVEDGRVSA